MIIIDPKRIRDIRLRRHLTRRTLAERSKISERTLWRYETDPSDARQIWEMTAQRLAQGLGVDVRVLTGEAPLPDFPKPRPEEDGQRSQVNAEVGSDVRLAFDLVKKRYSVSATTLVHLAPLLFTLAAEGSLAWRREKVSEIDDLSHQLAGLASGHLSFANLAERIGDEATSEFRSIQKLDLFGRELGERTHELGYDPSANNPFADYLRHLAATLDSPEVVQVEEGPLRGYGPLADFPEHRVCQRLLDEASGGSREARLALEFGFARLDAIPDELWEDGARDARAAWLCSQMPDDARASFLVALGPDDLDGVLDDLHHAEQGDDGKEGAGQEGAGQEDAGQEDAGQENAGRNGREKDAHHG